MPSEMGTMGGAAVLGRQDEIGSLEVGKLADLAVWRLDTLPHIDIADPVAALVLGAQPPLELLLVNGRPIVEQDELLTVDEVNVAQEVEAASKRLFARVGVADDRRGGARVRRRTGNRRAADWLPSPSPAPSPRSGPP